mgnify:FL=1
MCRVLAYVEDNLILSKKEGGEWGISNIPEKYRILVAEALREYQNGLPMKPDKLLSEEFADYMLTRTCNACRSIISRQPGQ